MPYIKKERRHPILMHESHPKDAGELNFLVTSIIHNYIRGAERINYSLFNEITGVLECAKLELYRRWVVPYEDLKISENGDVKP